MALSERLAVALQSSTREATRSGSVPCKVAAVVWEDAQERFKRYSTLVYVLALLALASIILAVVFFLVADEGVGEGLISLVAGLLTGGVAGFILTERDTARKDRDAAHKIINEQCGDSSPEDVLSQMG